MIHVAHNGGERHTTEVAPYATTHNRPDHNGCSCDSSPIWPLNAAAGVSESQRTTRYDADRHCLTSTPYLTESSNSSKPDRQQGQQL